MKRLWMGTVSAVLAVLMWSPQAHARQAAVDAFLLTPADRSLPQSAASASQRGLRINSVEGRLGVPTFVFSERSLSAGPQAKASRPLTQASANTAAREHLRSVADLYRLNASEVNSAELRQVHMPKGGEGAVVATYGRRVNGIEVFRNEVKVVMDASQQLVAISGYLQPRQQDDEKNAQASAFRVSAPQAISRAFQDLTGAQLDARALVPAGAKGDYSHYTVDSRQLSTHGFGEAPRSKKVLFPMPDGLVPAYYVEVNAGPESNPDASYTAYVIDARDGSLLLKHNLTVSEQFSYRVWADPASKLPYDGPQGTEATPHPTGTPDGYQAPLNIPANLVTLQNFPFSRNDPWLPANATVTTGNNVDAYADLGGGDGFQPGFDLRAPLSDVAGRGFDYTFDLTKSPAANQTQRLAAVVNLFYITNFLHDWFYDAGFDEASGNAQLSNFGRGGLENDSLRVEAQDSGGRNNANMATPADGARPRMQQYVFDGVAELSVSEPAPLARGYLSYTASFGPTVFNLEGDFALPPTGPDEATTLAYRIGCADINGADPYGGTTPFTGKIALIERGTCSFAYKVLNAQRAGAIGVFITNSAAGALGPMGASGVAAVDRAITIPSLLVTKPDGDAWRTALATAPVKGRLRRNADLDRDGTLDNEIVAHEWGHYISNRLVGNGSGLTNNQGGSMGEGWGDFHAMLLSVRAEDVNRTGNNQWQGTYGMAGYTQSGGRNQGYYFGIRRVPYSTNMAKNGLTLRHMADGTAIPTTHPTNGGGNNAEVHNSGEVWASMLWECYASLLNAHPFQEAQDRMKRYLVAAYKATPVSPTFLEGRDALLSVAAASDPADYQRFVSAFAKRGAGFGARVADRNSADHIGVVESYQTGDALEVVSITLDDSSVGCDKDGVLDAGETGLLKVTVRNAGAGNLSAVTATAAFNGSSPGVVGAFSSGSSLSFGNIARGATATASVAVALTAAPAQASGALALLGVDVTFPHNLLNGTTLRAFRSQVNYDEKPNTSDTDYVEAQNTPWVASTFNYRPMWDNGYATTGYWHTSNEATSLDKRLTSPLFNVAANQNFTLTFFHRFSFESAYLSGAWVHFDGGAIELSVDEGPWENWYLYLTPPIPANPNIALIDEGNPYLGGWPGFAQLSAGYPSFARYTANFGQGLAGHQVRVRFRHASDGGVGAYGWDIANISLTGITNTTPFYSLVAETFTGTGTAPTCNVAPVAEAGLSQTVTEVVVGAGGVVTPRVITLNGTGSVDPDASAQSTLTYAWTQIGGPPVTLNGANTATPTFSTLVPANTIFTFQLVVSDGTDSSQPKVVQVLVANVNNPPVAVARVKDGGPTTVDERSGSVTLDASGSTDADGEELSFSWTQTAGPAVALDDETSATPTFAVPEVTADTAFTFSLIATDGIADSEAEITITVRQLDRAPVADAGGDRQVGSGSTVTLLGGAVDEDGEDITFAWTQTEGPTVELTGADTGSPRFTAPEVTGASIVLRFSLVATANGQASAASIVTITVTRDNHAPVVTTMSSYTVHEGSGVKMRATAEDADGNDITWQWTQVAGPSVQLEKSDTAEAFFVAPEVSETTVLLFRVRAKDDLSSSEPAEVAVTVRNLADEGGCSAAGGSATSALVPALAMLALALRRRRRS
ncbi:histidine kinase [Myxococcus llanfairpwllgwyngyllgogerychwyrndrobwllllantysiliogogogochensis]|uniref:Histidine kinase n=1 Tax=Myxococcus llanfairpwllgwyngyllgogerychwyrndrobwllllantysiliogogogochensis TaxID=2590453 RepID=A0A540WN79_9BACT|nr:myxosortase-dependent M36 family metallopeptidase [Myxococcus llanfairpwllgwyngyllgogerychwyrndrobwllllantysiliogogogochensis]TQF10472.1 histidine kinase [Myxococcus llanfairpwllgwyngyllgogerychwyrndrobwllllantysiliogogogochensis]